MRYHTMLYAIAILSMLGSIFCFGAWISPDTSNGDLFIPFVICLIITVLSGSISNLKDTVKKQEERIKALEKQHKNEINTSQEHEE